MAADLASRLVANWVSFIKEGRPLAPWTPWEYSEDRGDVSSGGNGESYYVLNVTGDTSRVAYRYQSCALLRHLDFVWNPPTLSGAPSYAATA